MTDLPGGWANTTLSAICAINPRVNKSAVADDGIVAFVPMSSVKAETGRIDLSLTRPFGTVRQGYTSFTEGDVLFAKITPCMENGKMAIVPEMISEHGFGSTEFHVLRPATGIDPRFVYHVVSNRTFRFHAEHNMTGAVGQKRVPVSVLSEHSLRLPPTHEQRRIVERIETLFDEIDRGVESLEVAKNTIALYRQSLLKSAFEGQLTSAWRAQNPDKLESPDVLLARIREERERRYRAALDEWKRSVAEWKKGGTKGRRPAKPKRPRAIPVKPTNNRLQGWTAVPLGLTVIDPIYGTSKKCDYGLGATGVLRIPNIGSGCIDPSDMKSANFDERESEKYALREGDVLIVRSNGSLSIVGRSAIILRQHTDYIFAGYIIRIRPISESILPMFLLYLMMEPNVRAQIEAKSKSTSGVNNISARELQELNVPICSIAEQTEIVRILEARFEAVEMLDMEIDANLARADALRQSILKKAFSGELVPQDPNDEPAAILLERIQAVRARAPTRKRRTRVEA